MTRRFESKTAVRAGVAVFIGLAGPPGSGKTYSALELATGLEQKRKKPIFFIDTQAGRALYYADTFDFQHINFDPPYSPDDYWGAICHAVDQGAGTIIVDSASHEHSGVGGVQDIHDTEVERQVKRGRERHKVGFSCWKVAKEPRQRLTENIKRLKANLIFCFEGKDKLSAPVGNKAPVKLGWVPIGGAEYAYAMDLMATLPPGSKGVPDWRPRDIGTVLVTKRPKQFEAICPDGKQLNRKMGEAIAAWAAGPASEATPALAIEGDFVGAFTEALAQCQTREDMKKVWMRFKKDDRYEKHVEELKLILQEMFNKVLNKDAPVATGS